MCSLSIKSKQVCLPCAESPGLFPKHRLVTPSRVCRTHKGAQQDPTGRRGGLPPGSFKLESWSPGQRLALERASSVSRRSRMSSSVIVIFYCFLRFAADLLIGRDPNHAALLWVACVPGPPLPLPRLTGARSGDRLPRKDTSETSSLENVPDGQGMNRDGGTRPLRLWFHNCINTLSKTVFRLSNCSLLPFSLSFQWIAEIIQVIKPLFFFSFFPTK